MALCDLCLGPIVQCSVCRRWHCDDPGCIPITCAVAEDDLSISEDLMEST